MVKLLWSEVVTLVLVPAMGCGANAALPTTISPKLDQRLPNIDVGIPNIDVGI